MSFWDPNIRKTSIKFLILATIQGAALVYLYTLVGNPVVSKETMSGIAYTGLFVVAVFIIAFGMVYYQKTAESTKKKVPKGKMSKNDLIHFDNEKRSKYDTANLVRWTCLLLCFWAGGHFYVIRQDISYLGVSFASFVFFLYHFPSGSKFKNDFF